MTSKRLFHRAIALVAGLALLTVTVGKADFRSQAGTTFVSTVKLERAKKLDELTSSIAIPPDIDRSQPLGFTCTLQTLILDPDDFSIVRVENVKAKWETRAYVLDQQRSLFQVFDVAGGRFKTDDFWARVTISIPSDVTSKIFVDGFESGNVSALLVTHARLTKGKKINEAILSCSLRESDR